MPRKKLPHFEILRIEETKKGDPLRLALRKISFDEIRDVDAPDGTYAHWLSNLYLPKRKRGVKFNVVYTQIFQKEL
jgi:hypothetical protein